MEDLIILAELLLWECPTVEVAKVNRDVKRGLDYYKDGKGFEITCEKLGSSKQIVGGGEYDGGVGFAVGIDRILSINE